MTARYVFFRCAGGAPATLPLTVENRDDVERERLVVDDGDRLGDTVVAKLEVRGRQAGDRPSAVGHE